MFWGVSTIPFRSFIFTNESFIREVVDEEAQGVRARACARVCVVPPLTYAYRRTSF